LLQFRINGALIRKSWMLCGLACVCFLGMDESVLGAGFGMRTLHGNVPKAIARFHLQPIGQLAATNHLSLAIGLPLHNRAELDELLRQLYDPASPNYHKFLTPEEFTARFGPTEADYAAIQNFARTNGLTVAKTYGNRMLLDVTAPATAVENAFHVTLRTYRHPTENRNFFAPDAEPTVDSNLPIADVSGLENYSRPYPKFHLMPKTASPRAFTGSGPSSEYIGNDFRNAYAPGTSLNGSGQAVGLFELDGYYASDIESYAATAGGGRTNIVIQPVLIDKVSGKPGYSGIQGANLEVSLDIELAMAIAPKLTKIMVFEGSTINDVLNAMAATNSVKNLSSSWGWGGGPSTTTDNIFIMMAADGQSFFNASGDSDAFPPGSADAEAPSSSPYITQVGGTTLTMNGSGTSYASETVWNWGIELGSSESGVGTSGGVSSYYSIPVWQQGINSFLNNGGSMTMRNIPDVAMTADNIYATYGNGSSTSGSYLGGTSCAAPLWAGFMALVNQQAVAGGKTSGFGLINPAIYQIANESIYHSAFNDITTGNDTWSSSPNAFYAVPGYDLCTGVGTPAGTNLINALVNPDPLIVVSNGGFNAFVSLVGTFTAVSQTFYLTNVGTSSLTWSLINTSSWLNVTSSGGTLAGGAGGSAVVSLNPAATNLSNGIYTANLGFSNVTSGVTHYRFFTLTVSDTLNQNGGFETGDFTGWTLNGSGYPYNYVTNSITYNIGTRRHATNITINPHSGTYFAALGEVGAQAYLSQTLPTVAGQKYLLSLWMDSPDGETPNEFSVSWNGGTIFDQTNLSKLGWTNLQFLVTATGGSTVLQIGGRDDNAWLGLDDVSVTPVLAPTIALASSENPSGYKDNLNFTAALTPTNAGGSVQFLTNGISFDNESLVAGNAASVFTVALPRGTNQITAIYSGDANDLPATNTLAQVVTNHPPTATPFFANRFDGFPLQISVDDLSSNWSDVDGDTVSLAAIGVSTNGVTIADKAGTLYYSNSNNVDDEFTCTITDGFGGANFQDVYITILPLPTNAIPAITSLVNSGNTITLNLAGASGFTYVLETTTNLAMPDSWQPVVTNVVGTNGLWQFSDTITNNPQQFYRLQLLQ
jgi:Pro-kumamolisin, activation domain/Bacterial Ig-like domain (group 3)